MKINFCFYINFDGGFIVCPILTVTSRALFFNITYYLCRILNKESDLTLEECFVTPSTLLYYRPWKQKMKWKLFSCSLENTKMARRRIFSLAKSMPTFKVILRINRYFVVIRTSCCMLLLFLLLHQHPILFQRIFLLYKILNNL